MYQIGCQAETTSLGDSLGTIGLFCHFVVQNDEWKRARLLTLLLLLVILLRSARFLLGCPLLWVQHME